MSVKLAGNTTNTDVEVDTVPKAMRTSLYDSAGAALGIETKPLYTKVKYGSGTKVGDFACSTFRILGTAATPQNIASIENPGASGKQVLVRRITIQTDSTAILITVSPSIKLSRPVALPTGGTVIPAVPFNASDGGAATAITATAGNTIWTRFVDKLYTAVGWMPHAEYNLLPLTTVDEPLVLKPGEALLIQGVTANAATTFFIVNISWTEIVP